MQIKFIHRPTGKIIEEKVYGQKSVEFLYDTLLGKKLWPFFTSPIVSALYGAYQESSLSEHKIDKFVKKFAINLDEFLPSENGSEDIPYRNFNDFFIRRFKDGQRKFPLITSELGAFSEARYLAWNKIEQDQTFPVKVQDLSAYELLGKSDWYKYFVGGPLAIARLCPVDYHRFHYPDDGKIISRYRIKGSLHSVNPLALKYKSNIFWTNERVVNILETKNFGLLAYIEVGATCVGKIIQSHYEKNPFVRGEEKGYFLFGGSTVIVLGQPHQFKWSEDIVSNTKNSLETWVPLGDPVASKI